MVVTDCSAFFLPCKLVTVSTDVEYTLGDQHGQGIKKPTCQKQIGFFM